MIMSAYQALGDEGIVETFVSIKDGICTLTTGVNFRTTSKKDYDQYTPLILVEMDAEQLAQGKFTTAIEPDGGKWKINLYQRPSVSASDEMYFDKFNDAVLAGRRWFQELTQN